MSVNVLRCAGLTKSFGGVQALVGVGIDFPPAGVVAIIGPNGAGKTTLINVLSGLVRPDAGRFSFNGKDLTGLAVHEIARHGIARTFQDLRLITGLTVLENVILAQPTQNGERLLRALFGIGVAEEEARNREAALELLPVLGLERQADKVAGELSYGQQKLLTLVCCLATGAQVLLLDEPVAGVHPDMIEIILALLRRLREQGKLVVFIEHDIDAVQALSDWVIVMDEGRFITQGVPAEVLESPEIVDAYFG